MHACTHVHVIDLREFAIDRDFIMHEFLHEFCTSLREFYHRRTPSRRAIDSNKIKKTSN